MRGKSPGNWLLFVGIVPLVISLFVQPLGLLIILLPMLMVFLYEPFFRTRLIGDSAVAVVPIPPAELLAGGSTELYRRVARDSLLLLTMALAFFFTSLIADNWAAWREYGFRSEDLKLWGSMFLVFAFGSMIVVLSAFAAPVSQLLAGGVRPMSSLIIGLLLCWSLVMMMNLVAHPMEFAEERFARPESHSPLPDTFLPDARPAREWLLSPFYFLEVGRGTFISGGGKWPLWLAALFGGSLAVSFIGQWIAVRLYTDRLRK